ncbi:alpha/beta hydrolase [Streptosporangium sp. CA-135522]|uniref:alpha/beta hydrolase n=1 Tax=Streptosporangium sp. CA-135522 TaxID=3240072 RepID=UPI003D91409E
MNVNRRKMITLAAALAAIGGLDATASPTSAAIRPKLPGDAELAASLPGGFRSAHAYVNGIRLHYVTGGAGEPLVLLPGWPATWWSYHKVMPALARRYRVIAVDIRGMGASDKPAGGFDKKTMARDVHELVRTLGHDSVNIAGHDIGAMVAFSFAANHPAATRKLALLDVLHPDESLYQIPMLQRPGGDTHMWWWAFNQVRGLPEQLLANRSRFLIDWHYGIGLVDQSTVTDRDRAIYARVYDKAEAIRASNGWYQACHQDIQDMKTYAKVSAPVLGLVAPDTRPWFEGTLPQVATDVRGIVTVDKALHWLCEEDPELVSQSLAQFFA